MSKPTMNDIQYVGNAPTVDRATARGVYLSPDVGEEKGAVVTASSPRFLSAIEPNEILVNEDGTLPHVYILTVEDMTWQGENAPPLIVGVFALRNAAQAEAQKRQEREVEDILSRAYAMTPRIEQWLSDIHASRTLIWKDEAEVAEVEEKTVPAWWALGCNRETLYTVTEYPVNGEGVLDQVVSG